LRRPKKHGTSKRLRQKQKFEIERGNLKRDGQDWSRAEHDQLLDWWIAGRGIGWIADKMDRPPETIKNMVWKLATGYKRCRHYKRPDHMQRQSHNGGLTRRERQIIEWGLFGQGQKRDPAVDCDHIAEVLNRPVEVIKRYVSDKTQQGEGFGLI
jgi:hypothetical protein